MAFNSIHFIIFFGCMMLIVALLRRHIAIRNLFLLAGSYYFYGCWDRRFLGLLWFSTLLDYACARLLGMPQPGQLHRPVRDRAILAVSIVCNLGLLGFFKYYGFFASSAVALLGRMGIHAELTTLKIILPVGISFYTFQTMSYVIDVYRGQMTPEKSLLNFALYVTYFPQLVAGPIERADRLIPQLAAPTRFTWQNIYSGTYLMASGLFKKVVIADNVAKVVDAAFSQSSPTGAMSLLGMYGFAIQIYCDFSGYTDIARGAARCMGVELMRNFDLPYFATNPADLWHRWHISLSTWLRDYLYISLGGNRKGRIRTYVNLMLTMCLGGLWHGAAWTYVIWGTYHGALLCVHRAASPFMQRWLDFQGAISRRVWFVLRVLVMFNLWSIGMLIFRASSMHQAIGLLKAMCVGAMTILPTQQEALAIVIACGALLLIVQIVQAMLRDEFVIFRVPRPVRAVVYAAAILCFFAFGEYYGEAFIYFQF